MNAVLRWCATSAIIATLGGVHTGCSKGRQEPAAGTLDQAWQILSTRRWVDLTHTFGPGTPVWSGFGPALFTPATNRNTGRPFAIETDGFRTLNYSLVGQYGTHIDPPAHFSAQGQTLDQLSVTNMILRLVVFDMTPRLRQDPNHALTVSDILEWESSHGRVPQGAFAALRTDLSKDWESDPLRFQRSPFPGWTLEAIRFLYEQRGITANGHEAMDTDTTETLESEAWLLQNGH